MSIGFDSECPKCKRNTLEGGYGLAGGGFGPYFFCDSDECDFFEKFREPNTPQSEVKP